MKNLIYILIGVGFLAIISSSASSFLTTETSSTLDNLYIETFYIDPESVILLENEVSVTLVQNDGKNAEKKIMDCIEFYKTEYLGLNVSCDLVIKTNVALKETCNLLSGKLTYEEDFEVTNLIKNKNC